MFATGKLVFCCMLQLIKYGADDLHMSQRQLVRLNHVRLIRSCLSNSVGSVVGEKDKQLHILEMTVTGQLPEKVELESTYLTKLTIVFGSLNLL
jgi:hypothetical protein